jgi:hypothetical protein
LALFLFGGLLFGGVAHARAGTDAPYALSETFSTALRFVRVDRGCQITDKDASAAYVTFACPDEEDKVKRGSLEIFPTKSGVRLQVALGDEPHYMEVRFLELLERKLRDERGTPPPAPAPPPRRAPPDGGAE